MKRPALYIGIPYVLGLTFASVIVQKLWLTVLGSVITAALAILIWRRDLWKYVLLSTLSCLTACCVYWHADALAQQQLALSGTEIAFTGTVTQASVYPSGWARYYLDGTFADGQGCRVEFFTDAALFEYGDALTLSGTPERLTSDYLFDDAAFGRSNRVFLTYGAETRVTAYERLKSPTLRSTILHWRAEMTARIQAHMRDETGAMLTGMLFGDKTGMTRSSKTALYRMGIGHVLAVSGLHLDFIALIAAWIFKRLYVGRKTTFVLMAMLCLLFVICAGETVSVKRACIMILISQSGRVLFRRADALNSLSLAMLVLGIENPFVVCGMNFWLSVSATFGIAVLAPYMTKNMPRESPWQAAIAEISCFFWAFAAMLPVEVLCFREISLLSPVSNLLLVPLCMGAMLFGMLGILCGGQGSLAALFLGGADALGGWVLEISRAVSEIPWTRIPTGSSDLFVILMLGVGFAVGVHLICKSRKATTFAVIAALTVTMLSVKVEQTYRRGHIRIAMLGEGRDCLLVVSSGEDSVLFDLTGGSSAAAYAQAYLSDEGITKVGLLCLCDPSPSSIRGYEDYLSSSQPEAIWVMQEVDEDFPQLFGREPIEVPTLELLFHGAKLSSNDTALTVDYAGNTCVFTRSAREITGQPEVLGVFGTLKKLVPDCGVLSLTDADTCYLPDGHTYIDENPLELTLANDGTCRIRRLYGKN